MKQSTGNFVVDVTQVPQKGTPWVVSVYRKILGFRKRISSDWFLDEEQAQSFASQVIKEIKSTGSPAVLDHRKPGWTLRNSS
jgi:hypothetical protein